VRPPPPALAPGPFVPAPPPPPLRLCFHPVLPARSREGRGGPRNGASGPGGPGRGCLCARRGRGRPGPGGALPGPERPEAATVVRWERLPDAGRIDLGSRCVARGRMALQEPIPLPSLPPPRARGTGVHGPAKGTFATFERARTGRGRGGDPASGASAALPGPAGPAPPQHKGNPGRGRSGAGWGPGRPAHWGASWSCPLPPP
jgi:hypothetical protein